MCCDRNNKGNQEEEKFGSKNAEKARDLGKQVNPYDLVGTVENNGYPSFTTSVSIHGGRKATKKYKSVALLDSGSPSSFVTQAVINKVSTKSGLNIIYRLNPLVIFPVKVRNSFEGKYFRHLTHVLVRVPETKGMSKFTVPHFSRGESIVHSSVERM